jgi:hypothetical protein
MNEAQRIAHLPWALISESLSQYGCAKTPQILQPSECADLRQLYTTESHFRKRVNMAQHGFGSGEYKYFAYPLPDMIATLRTVLYRQLVTIANQWQEQLGLPERFPPEHAAFVAQCHAAGQNRPTPLLLRYGANDYNCLHQDLYGPMVFPLQVVFLLSKPDVDFQGGAFVLTEQRPRSQSRAEVVHLTQGEAVIFAVNARPTPSARGSRRVNLRHGVSRIIQGERVTLGIIFHDAA